MASCVSNALPLHAAARFGLGAKPGELTIIGNDPRGWTSQQLKQPRLPASLTPDDALKFLVRETQGEKNRLILTDAVDPANRNKTEELRPYFLKHTAARFAEQASTDQPFLERLVLFWSNHFTVSLEKVLVAGMVHRYEYEAIRPHVLGYFSDMLLAVARSPAMLYYLDNAQSIGPNSRIGTRRDKRGLNENLAREILELHTLGVEGGYSQPDVVALANIITGWTLAKVPGSPSVTALAFEFMPAMHEPGEKLLLGKRIAEAGEEEGVAALRMLANHPSTARHLATKLARHFIHDTPPSAAVEALTRSYLQSGGHLGTVMQTLIALPESWQHPLVKVKTPYEYLLSAYRLTQADLRANALRRSFESLNYRPFSAGSPKGEPDTAADWAAPDAVMKRIEWAHRFSQILPARTDPMQLATEALGDALTANTRQTIERAASGSDGIAFLLASPEFMRR